MALNPGFSLRPRPLFFASRVVKSF